MLFGANLVAILLILSISLMFVETIPVHGDTRVAPYRIHLPSATEEELQLLPGIGPKTSKRIVEYRLDHEINNADDLTEIHGIGEKTVEGIQQLTADERIDQ